jgi:TonB family protein
MSSSASQTTLFCPLPEARKPWTEFVFGSGMQAGLVALVIWVRLLYPAVVEPPQHSFNSIELVATPPPVNHEPQPLRQLPKPVVVAALEVPATALRMPAPQPKTPVKVEDTAAPTISVAPRKLDPLPMNSAPVIPKEAVKTNVFNTGSSQAPTIAAQAPSHVQTGGFGDPNGLPAKPGQSRAVNIAAAGSFDLPSGPGYGNGTGGAKGVPGVIASSGFGNGTANPVPGRGVAGSVQAGGFGDSNAPVPVAHTRTLETSANAFPAEILSKPSPIYTQEARNLHIEGEVLLEVVLQASGNLKVVRVVRGLGHGLDDNAVKAALQIHFKPATRDGQPTDSTVVLHIVFQLA